MRHSAVCTAAAPASSVPTARWLIREKNQLGLYLAWLYLISRCFLLLLFSPCNFNLLTKVCAKQETDRQSERAITARDGEMGICSSAGAWAALIPFNILTFIKGFIFLQVLFVTERTPENPFFERFARQTDFGLELF